MSPAIYLLSNVAMLCIVIALTWDEAAPTTTRKQWAVHAAGACWLLGTTGVFLHQLCHIP